MSPAIERNPPWIANTGTCPVFDDDYRFQLRFANGDEFDGDTAAEDYDWRLDLPPSDKITHWRTWEPSKQVTAQTPIASKQASSTEAALHRLTDNERELGLLEEMLSPKSGTYTVFSTSKTYDSEAEAREAALKFAATGGVWHVAKVIGSAVPKEPEWWEAV